MTGEGAFAGALDTTNMDTESLAVCRDEFATRENRMRLESALELARELLERAELDWYGTLDNLEPEDDPQTNPAAHDASEALIAAERLVAVLDGLECDSWLAGLKAA